MRQSSMKEDGKSESRRRAKNMGCGVTVPGAISGFATCCHVALARSHACFEHLHPLNAGIAAMYHHTHLRSYLVLGVPQENGDDWHLHNC